MVNEPQVAIHVPPRPSFMKRVAEGVTFGLIISVTVIAIFLGASQFIGDSPLEKRVDRNAAITTAGMNGIRCILKIKPDPERPYKEMRELLNDCFAEYDRLVSQGE